MANYFAEDIPAKVAELIDATKEKSQNIDWNTVFNETDILETQKTVMAEMRDLGMTEEQIQKLSAIKPEVREGIGWSSVGEETAFASRLQAVRRAIDYVKVFGEGVTVEQVARAFLTSTIAHELGHSVSDIAGVATNRLQNEWVKDGEFVDSKNERFAEYWGYVPFANDEESRKIVQREWLIQLHKTTEVWDALKSYNDSHEEKIDLFAVFRGIEDKLDAEKDADALALLQARRTIYRGSPIENYASPYSREIVAQSVK